MLGVSFSKKGRGSRVAAMRLRNSRKSRTCQWVAGRHGVCVMTNHVERIGKMKDEIAVRVALDP